MTLQSSSRFKNYLVQNIQDGSLSQAERAAADISALLDNWVAKITVALPRVNIGNTSKQDGDDLQSIIRNDRDVIAISVFLLNGTDVRLLIQANSSGQDIRLEGTTVQDIVAKTGETTQKWVTVTQAGQSRDSDQSSSIQTRSLGPAVDLPILQMSVPFRLGTSGSQKIVVVMTAWQEKILRALPKSRVTNGFIVDQSGNIFASRELKEMVRKTSLSALPIVQQAMARNAPSGFQNEYKDAKGKSRLGAFSQIGKFPGLFVIVEKDAEAAFRVITRSYVTAALWGTLFVLIAIMASFIGASTVTRSLRELLAATKQIAAGNFAIRVEPRSSDEVAELGNSVNHMAVKITELMSHQVEKARFEKELETARMVQSTFFPKTDVQKEYLNVTGFYQPATECGGDLWGHYTISDGREFLFIADAMGHGAPAALVTAIGYAVCQAVAEIVRDTAEFDSSPSRLLERCNRIIFDAVEGKISMTFFAALLDFNNGKMTFANAGHNFPVILTSNKSDSRLAKGSKSKAEGQAAIPISLILQGVPLGVDRLAVFKEKTIDLMPGDRIFFFTDGLIENSRIDGDPMGRKKMLEILSEHGAENCHEIKKAMLKDAFSIFGETNLADDVTVVVAEISKTWVMKPDAYPTPPLTKKIDEALTNQYFPPIPQLAEVSFNQNEISQPVPMLLEAFAIANPIENLSSTTTNPFTIEAIQAPADESHYSHVPTFDMNFEATAIVNLEGGDLLADQASGGGELKDSASTTQNVPQASPSRNERRYKIKLPGVS